MQNKHDKKEEKDALKDIFPSDKMLENIKNAKIKQEEVKAKKENSVLIYRIEEIEAYRKQFVKQFENNIGDTFVFDKYATMWRKDESGNRHKTGWFCPASFWDAMEKIIKFNQTKKYD